MESKQGRDVLGRLVAADHRDERLSARGGLGRDTINDGDGEHRNSSNSETKEEDRLAAEVASEEGS